MNKRSYNKILYTFAYLQIFPLPPPWFVLDHIKLYTKYISLQSSFLFFWGIKYTFYLSKWKTKSKLKVLYTNFFPSRILQSHFISMPFWLSFWMFDTLLDDMWPDAFAFKWNRASLLYRQTSQFYHICKKRNNVYFVLNWQNKTCIKFFRRCKYRK